MYTSLASNLIALRGRIAGRQKLLCEIYERLNREGPLAVHMTFGHYDTVQALFAKLEAGLKELDLTIPSSLTANLMEMASRITIPESFKTAVRPFAHP